MAHGIEPASVRAEAGKPEVGTIGLRAERLGDWLRLVVEDDGRGVDAARIRELAVERGALSEPAARAAQADDLLSLLFAPGLSTHDRPDLLAGRGVGLPLAHDLVCRMGGAIRLAQRSPYGLTATIEVPSEAGLVEVLWLSCAGHDFALPRAFSGSVAPIEEAPDAIALSACLDLPDPHQPRLSLELALYGVDPIRIGVDAVGQPEETRIRPIPALLSAAGPYSGAILRGDGSLRLALDVALLAARAWAHSA
jgi:two-component system chemotaxis sensor kinase CheA